MTLTILTYLGIALALFLFGLLVMLNRGLLVYIGRWILHRRYDVKLSGTELLVPGRTYLVLPNHPAIVDPLILTPEVYKFGVVLRPLIDESFFSSMLFKHIFMMFDAVRVPDFRHINFRPILKIRPSRHDSVSRARKLAATVIETLAKGGSVLMYPSGHITYTGREELSNRQLAHTIVSHLPKDVIVLGVRIRGLYGSMWSRVGGRQPPRFVWTFVKGVFQWFFTCVRTRRKVSICFENITDLSRSWTSEDRKGFNAHLEKWYDADLTAKGLESEPAS